MKAFKYYYIPMKEIGLGGIVVEPTPDMVEAAKETDRCTGTVHVTHRYRRRLREDAECARDQPGHPRCASEHYSPHVTIGVGTAKYLDTLLAAPFPAFNFSAVGVSAYQFGNFGTAAKLLHPFKLTQ